MWNPFKKKQKKAEPDNDEFEALWGERMASLEKLYGKSDDMVGHAVIPFFLGPEMGGAADVVYFSSHVPGRLSVTAELIGCEEQKRSPLGNYELAVVHRTAEEPWGPTLISRLAHYTLESVLAPGETMDIGEVAPEGSTVDGLLFLDYGQFQFRGKKAGVLLCLGITAQEKQICLAGKTDSLIVALKSKNIYPYTDMKRESVI